MNRTLTAFTAAIFATAIAIPALAQVGTSGEASTTSSSSESSKQEYHSVAPGPASNSVESSKSEYKSERSDSVTAPAAPPEQVERQVENKVTTHTTTSVVPPPVVNETTTTRRTVTDRSDASAQ